MKMDVLDLKLVSHGRHYQIIGNSILHELKNGLKMILGSKVTISTRSLFFSGEKELSSYEFR